VALGLALVVAVAGRGPEEGNPLDPASPGPLGTKGLVEVLRGLGGRVSVSADRPGAGTETALLLSDDLTPERRQGVLDWVRRGGTLVVADPGSGVTEVEPVGSTRIGLLDAEIERRCGRRADRGPGRRSRLRGTRRCRPCPGASRPGRRGRRATAARPAAPPSRPGPRPPAG
jgi:hypothetical protein